MEKQGKLIGKIILADLLKYPLGKFIDFIRGVEEQPLYKKLSQKGIVTCERFSGAKVLEEEGTSSGVIARIKKEGGFSTCYSNKGFSIEYMVDNEKLQRIINDGELTEEEKKDIGGLLNKLRRISTRNLITHEVLKGILNHQRDYFETDDELNLKPLRMVELARAISRKNSRGITVDTSRISRIIQTLSLVTPQGREISLRSLFPTKRDRVKRHLKVLLNEERGKVYNGELKIPYKDEELRGKLRDSYNSSVIRREVAYCRKELGIPSYSERVSGYGYTLLPNFSAIYPFTIPSVKNNAPKCPGVYELRLENDKIDYPKGSCQIFYIGSGENLRKRLLSHLSPNGGNGDIKKFIEEKSCAFRYVQLFQGWGREEKKLYELFVSTFGDSPLCNHVSPKEGVFYER